MNVRHYLNLEISQILVTDTFQQDGITYLQAKGYPDIPADMTYSNKDELKKALLNIAKSL